MIPKFNFNYSLDYDNNDYDKKEIQEKENINDYSILSVFDIEKKDYQENKEENEEENEEEKKKKNEEHIKEMSGRIDKYKEYVNILTPYQKTIFDECINKKNGGLSLPMGSGKTLISILVAKHLSKENELILVVCSKSLIHNWTHEIHKFFKDNLKYEILHTNSLKDLSTWKPNKDTKLILTTSDVIGKNYSEHNVLKKFITIKVFKDNPWSAPTRIKYYNNPEKPFLDHQQGGGLLFSIPWGCLIIDEAQNYTNIESKRCQGISSIYAKHRWGLSGTLFNEPKAERILGYYTMLDINGVPRNLPDMERHIRSYYFTGLNQTIVERKNNDMFKPPKVNKIIVENSLSFEEAQLYISIKKTLNIISRKVKELKRQGDTNGTRIFSSYLLGIISYIRQSLICPLIPITNVAIDMADYNQKSQLSEILMNEINQLNLNWWLQDMESVKSSRIKKILETIDKHPNERIVLFSSFRTSLNLIKYYIEGKRKVFIMDSKMNLKKRQEEHENFEKSKNGIMLLTYEIGSVGLNLQSSAIVLLIDFWWNGSTTKQAIARVLRYGQTSEEVNIYYFTSNTGIEKSIFEKQINKLVMIEELQLGPIKTKIPKMRSEDIIKIINSEDNIKLLNNIL